MKLLVTGGTVFVSRYVASYFVQRGDEVYVMNRNTRPQLDGVRLIEADRHCPGSIPPGMCFDAIVDVTAYNGDDVRLLMSKIKDYDTYILISSSAVYPEGAVQPFWEDEKRGRNKFWGKYGTDKIEAEDVALLADPNAYILRPPYLYGPMNNLYREAFVFDCAMSGRKFFLPGDGEKKLQFFHVKDLCRIIEKIIYVRPEDHIFNVGNKEPVTIREWVELCYTCAGKTPEFVNVYQNIEQRNYFSFYDYEYVLDVTRQSKMISEVVDLKAGLMESYAWYKDNMDQVRKKPYIPFIDANLR